MSIVDRTGRAELLVGIVVICGVVGVLSALYSGAQGLDRAVDGAVGAVFALVGIAVWLAVTSRLR